MDPKAEDELKHNQSLAQLLAKVCYWPKEDGVCCAENLVKRLDGQGWEAWMIDQRLQRLQELGLIEVEEICVKKVRTAKATEEGKNLSLELSREMIRGAR